MLLIDAFNVLHVTGVLPPHLAGLDVQGLVRLIGISRYARRKLLLVCDGAPPRQHAARAAHSDDPRIIYVGTRLKADDLIRDRLASLPRSQNVLLISSDRELVRDARKRRFDTRSSDMFLRHLAHDEAQSARNSAAPRSARPPFAYEVPLDRASQEIWERLLGVVSASRARAADERPAVAPAARTDAEAILDADAIAEIESRLRQLLAKRPPSPGPESIRHANDARASRQSSRPAASPAPGANASQSLAGVASPGPELDPALLALLKDLSPDLSLADIDMEAVLRKRPPQGPRT